MVTDWAHAGHRSARQAPNVRLRTRRNGFNIRCDKQSDLVNGYVLSSARYLPRSASASDSVLDSVCISKQPEIVDQVKLTQEIMRHENSRVTIELYQQVSRAAKQELQARVVAVW